MFLGVGGLEVGVGVGVRFFPPVQFMTRLIIYIMD